ncbi:hypothetical protein U8V72_15440 [Priestia filamentosa]|uniref:hypothetical protein n=1 Tax=Priestia filamentosa TaxID=1402861 RepID=UPI000588F9F1
MMYLIKEAMGLKEMSKKNLLTEKQIMDLETEGFIKSEQLDCDYIYNELQEDYTIMVFLNVDGLMQFCIYEGEPDDELEVEGTLYFHSSEEFNKRYKDMSQTIINFFLSLKK